jgi:hypothetical protein
MHNTILKFQWAVMALLPKKTMAFFNFETKEPQCLTPLSPWSLKPGGKFAYLTSPFSPLTCTVLQGPIGRLCMPKITIIVVK